MISLDAILISFIQENVLTIGLALSILKLIAKETPWALDDKIINLFIGMFKTKNGRR